MSRSYTLVRDQLIPRPLDEVFPFFADAANLVAQADYNAFETEVVNEANPTALALDLFFELVDAPQAGEVLKGRLDFVSAK